MSFQPEKPVKPTDPGVYIYTRGEIARTMSRGDGIRKFLPFEVKIDVLLSPLSTTSDTFLFYLYQEHAQQAIKIAGDLLWQWYRSKRTDGFPKPGGHGYCMRITDKEFCSNYRQAVEQGKEVFFSGAKDDPVAYHIKPTSKTIITAL